MSKLKKIITVLLPWSIRRKALNRWFGYEIHPTARIGYSWIFPKHLVMEANSSINHLCVAVHLDAMIVKKNSSVGRNNWITGFPSGTNSKHFQHQKNRTSRFSLGESSAITKNHHLDCTNSLEIGDYTTIAGYQSQFLTHSIDVFENRQDSNPIKIGNYCFVGTNSVILGGAVLPSYSVLGAKSLLNKSYTQEWTLYGGTPAKPLTEIPKDAKYFNRTTGFVH